ncbi:hypothetical protein [Actinacidiphila yeochonensis]|uniref:hypothetical protein n=1 Tax=Actinacidiphila yeochonensis TaxID=89050 RepID=UPI00055DE3C3|nr:hypothetical protein [Actinacidiphila yeochonensis]
MTDIVVGQPDKVTAMPNEDKTGALPVDPLNEADLVGSAAQNVGHKIGGYWGRPLEDAGDSVHAFGAAPDDVGSIAGDLETGGLDGTVHDLKDAGDAVTDMGKNALDTVTDFF